MYIINPGNVVSPISEAKIAQRQSAPVLKGPSRVVCIFTVSKWDVVNLQKANWKITILKNGKSTISMGHFNNSYVTKYQRVLDFTFATPNSTSNVLDVCFIVRRIGVYCFVF